MRVLLFFIVLLVFLILMPLFIKVKLTTRVLTMSGSLRIELMGLTIYKCNYKIRGAYIHIKTKHKHTKQQLNNSNTKYIFIKKLITMLYFRQNITDVSIKGRFGYQNDAFITALICSTFDILATDFMCRLKNNKQSANIRVHSEPKYDKDEFSIEMCSKFNMSIFDILFALTITRLRLIGGNYERKKSANIQKNRVTN